MAAKDGAKGSILLETNWGTGGLSPRKARFSPSLAKRIGLSKTAVAENAPTTVGQPVEIRLDLNKEFYEMYAALMRAPGELVWDLAGRLRPIEEGLQARIC